MSRPGAAEKDRPILNRLHCHIVLMLIVSMLVGCAKKDSGRDVAQELERRIVLLEMKLSDSQARLASVEAELSRVDAGEEASEPPIPETADPVDAPYPVEEVDIQSQNLPINDPPPTSAALPGPEALYKRAYGHFTNRRHDQAESDFKRFVDNYGSHKLAPNAMYWSAEVEYDKKNFNKAILKFKMVVERFPDSFKAPDALLKLGKSRERLGQLDEAREEYLRVINRYPDSKAAGLARSWL